MSKSETTPDTKPNISQSKLRPLAYDDLERVLAWRNHLEVRRYMYTQHEISLEEHLRWFKSVKDNPRKHVLIYEVDHLPLGFVNFSEIGTSKVADWGYYAAPDAPKGTGRALGKAALDYAFKETHLYKVCGQAIGFNERSIRFHQSLGFQQEGLLRDQHFDGQRYHDVVCFGLLRQEWLTKP